MLLLLLLLPLPLPLKCPGEDLRAKGLSSAKMVDARDVLVVEPSEQDTVEVDYPDSKANIDMWHAENVSEEEDGNFPLDVTGFIAKRRDGRATWVLQSIQTHTQNETVA